MGMTISLHSLDVWKPFGTYTEAAEADDNGEILKNSKRMWKMIEFPHIKLSWMKKRNAWLK